MLQTSSSRVPGLSTGAEMCKGQNFQWRRESSLFPWEDGLGRGPQDGSRTCSKCHRTTNGAHEQSLQCGRHDSFDPEMKLSLICTSGGERSITFWNKATNSR